MKKLILSMMLIGALGAFSACKGHRNAGSSSDSSTTTGTGSGDSANSSSRQGGVMSADSANKRNMAGQDTGKMSDTIRKP